ncbi:Ribonuclease T [Rhodanobacter lindaniclasticus]
MDTVNNPTAARMAERFRRYLPVVVDVETGGFDAEHDALLEIAAIPLRIDEAGFLSSGSLVSTHEEPFPGANLDPRSLEITGIDPDNPLRGAVPNARRWTAFSRWCATPSVKRAASGRSGRQQRRVRPGLSEPGGAPLRAQAQSVSPRSAVSTQSPGRPGLRPDRAEQGGAGGGAELRQPRAHRHSTMPSARPSCSAASSTAGGNWSCWSRSTPGLAPR